MNGWYIASIVPADQVDILMQRILIRKLMNNFIVKILEADFTVALDNGDIKAFLQQKYYLQQGGWSGFEALARPIFYQYDIS